MSLRRITVVASALIVAACSSTRTPDVPTATVSTSQRPVACGAVSDLIVAPAAEGFGDGALAHAGPVWFSAFDAGAGGKARLREFVPGAPTKVLIHPDSGAHPEVQVRGVECASGQPLRFSYGYLPDDRVVTIPADQHVDYTGYMEFARSGKYMLSVSAGPSLLGTVVLQVG